MSSLVWGKRFENTVTGKRNAKICNLLDCENLTINNNFKYRRNGGTDHTTFNEIKVVPYQEALDPFWVDLVEAPPNSKEVAEGQFIDGFIESMIDYIEESWDPNKFHVILHSSGTDSRILSAILYEIYKNRGEDSFGNFLFACWGIEGKYLDLMMRAAGWNERDCISIPRYTDEFYDYNLDFEKASSYLNGASSYPINDLYWMLDALKLMNKIPADMDEVELWGAGYFNEVFKYILGNKTDSIKRFLRTFYYSFGSTMISALPCTFVPPILNPKTMAYIVGSDIDFNKGLRNAILKKINPDLLKIKRVRTPRSTPLPRKYALQTKHDYHTSWYGKNISPNPEENPVIAHDNWWLRWSAASLVGRYKQWNP